MKFTNIRQLLINFKGGGLINFPFKHLKEVDIDGDTDGQGGGDNDSLVDSALSIVNENKNNENFHSNILNLEEYNQNYKEHVSKEYGNGDNIVVFQIDDKQIAFKFTDDEFAEFMHKTALYNDWRKSYNSFPIHNIITIKSNGKQSIARYTPQLLGDFSGAILGLDQYDILGLTGKENFIKLNSINDVDRMFFRNDKWISDRCKSLNLNDYDFNQVFDSTFDIYKLKSENSIYFEFGLIKIVNKEDNEKIMFTTYHSDTYIGGDQI